MFVSSSLISQQATLTLNTACYMCTSIIPTLTLIQHNSSLLHALATGFTQQHCKSLAYGMKTELKAFDTHTAHVKVCI